ncbi:MAG: hypothetical protein L6R42_008468 [Xanthoria sp. 1 TBL-2021]|nr:MAG: hypothetical protein L6R42_008468 [Xanthoria sp. 1 TBL-2021]
MAQVKIPSSQFITQHSPSNYSYRSMPTRVISSEASAQLSLNGDSPISEGGWFHIRVRDISSSSSSSSEEAEPRVTIPAVLESVQALSFIGFTDRAADQIMYRHSLVSAHRDDVDILSFAKGHIRSAKDASLPWENWRDAMDEMGVKNSVQEAIMLPQFESLRLTQSAMFWVLDTISAKYMYLQSIDREVLGYARGPRRSESYVQIESRLSGESRPSSSSKPTQPSSSKAAQGKANPQPSQALHLGANDHQVGDGEIELLKGGTQVRLVQAFPSPADPPNDVINRLQNIFSAIPGDFSPNESALYFTKQRDVAYQYMDYARERTTEQSQQLLAVGILHVIIPTEFLADHAQIYGDEWREFVMHCRLQIGRFPSHLTYLKNTSVIMGPILKANDAMVRNVVGDGREFRRLEPWRLANGASAQQQCIKGTNLIEAINERARIWLEILP